MNERIQRILALALAVLLSTIGAGCLMGAGWLVLVVVMSGD